MEGIQYLTNDKGEKVQYRLTCGGTVISKMSLIRSLRARARGAR
jgi:hypothetical protein